MGEALCWAQETYKKKLRALVCFQVPPRSVGLKGGFSLVAEGSDSCAPFGFKDKRGRKLVNGVALFRVR